MPTPKMVLITTAQKAIDRVSWKAKITSGWLQGVQHRTHALGEGRLGHQRDRPDDQEEQVADHHHPQQPANRGAAAGWCAPWPYAAVASAMYGPPVGR